MKRIIIKTRLYLKRIWRVLKIMCPKTDIILYLLLVLLWLAFALITHYIAFAHDGESVTYLRTIWNLRNSIFTSIVLAFAIGAFNHLREYRRILKRQHFLYVDSMDDFEELFRAIVKDDLWLNFHALYNEKCKQISWDLVSLEINNLNISNNDIVMAFDVILERLDKIDYQLKNEMLIVKDEEILALEISESKKLITRIMIEEKKELFKPLINKLYNVVDELRYLWRRDLKLDMELLYMKEDPQNDFYLRMWLPDFSLVMIKNWP